MWPVSVVLMEQHFTLPSTYLWYIHTNKEAYLSDTEFIVMYICHRKMWQFIMTLLHHKDMGVVLTYT